jgi:hypothetical protein
MYDEQRDFAEAAVEPTEAAPYAQPDRDELPAEADGHDAADAADGEAGESENTSEL